MVLPSRWETHARAWWINPVVPAFGVIRGLVTFALVHNDDVQLIGGAACREHRRTHVDHDHAVRPLLWGGL